MTRLLAILAAWMYVGLAAAQGDLDIDTPAIAQFKTGMAQRYAQLLPWYQSVAVGLTRDGGVLLREPAAGAAPGGHRAGRRRECRPRRPLSRNRPRQRQPRLGAGHSRHLRPALDRPCAGRLVGAECHRHLAAEAVTSS
jgi:hypothetical protein